MVGQDISASLWRAFDHVYVVNLPHRADRRRQIAGELRRLGTDFDDPRVTLFEACRPDAPGNFPDIGSRGCFESHMGVLRAGLEAGHRRWLLLEDDMRLEPGAEARLDAIADRLAGADWDMFYAHGPTAHLEQIRATRQAPTALETLAPDMPLRLTHCVGFSAHGAARVLPFLEDLHGRPMFHPDGGAMHVDGAYSTFRGITPDFTVLAAVPRIAWQRPSHSDIHAPRWFEKVSALAPVVGAYRTIKDRLRR